MKQLTSETPIPHLLSAEHYPAITRRLRWSSPLYAIDTSFEAELSRRRAEQVEGYLFTAYSAVPLADAVRAFYETLGEPVPWLGYVHTAKVRCRAAGTADALKSEEIERLKPSLAHLGSICIVEQFVSTHQSLLFAHDCVSEATNGNVRQSDIRGRYYLEARDDDVDLTAISSVHRDFMLTIGQQAANTLLDSAQKG